MTIKEAMYKPDITIFPGETLNEIIEDLGVSQKELALRTGVTEKHISHIINGKSSITPEMAIRLQRVTRVKASFWNNLEKNHQERLAWLQVKEAILKEEKHFKLFSCYGELEKYKYLPKSNDKIEKIEGLLKFFGVDSLELVKKVSGVAFSKVKSKDIDKYSLAAWLRCGELDSINLELPSYNKSALKKNMPLLRSFTLEKDFGLKIKKLLSEFGVALVFTPYFKNTKIKGAFRWFKDRPLIQINDFGKRCDIFWFTLFHELGHLLLHGNKSQQFIDTEATKRDDLEKEADEFAANHLIPPNEYIPLIKEGDFSMQTILNFSKKVKIHPSITLGRLAHDQHISWSQASKIKSGIRIS